MHSFRSGCSITLSLLGVPHKEVAKLVGWKSVEMVSHYCRFDSVMSNEDASSVFSEAARPGTSAPSLLRTLGSYSGKGTTSKDTNLCLLDLVSDQLTFI